MKTQHLKHSSYLMESNIENKRLAEKVAPETFIPLYLHKHIRSKSTILDIGCGPATIVEKLSSQYTESKVTGLDISANRLIQAAKNISYPNLSFISANVYQLPYKNDSFDLVFSRLLFEYLQNPQQALMEMNRICKPGGIVLVQDIDGQLNSHFPEHSQQDNIEQTINDIHNYIGFDPLVGRKLYYYFYHTGLENINVQIEPYHLIYGRIHQTDETNWIQKLSVVYKKLSQIKSVDSSKLQHQIDDYIDYLKREDSLTFSNLFTVYGRKPYGK